MKNILIHGLGQDDKSWENVILELNNIKVCCPNLYDLVKEDKMNYSNLYKAFSKYCESKKDKLNLCGLSLGGILALDYTKEHPEQVNSIILIATPYEIPKNLFKIQNIIFKFMPRKAFLEMGCKKEDFINLVKSMENLDIKSNLDKIDCRTLIVCGKDDKANIEGSRALYEHIKDSELKIIENSMHEVNKDNPKELANIITKFFKDD